MNTLPTLLEDAITEPCLWSLDCGLSPQGGENTHPQRGATPRLADTHVSFQARCQRLPRTPLLTQLSVSFLLILSLWSRLWDMLWAFTPLKMGISLSGKQDIIHMLRIHTLCLTK